MTLDVETLAALGSDGRWDEQAWSWADRVRAEGVQREMSRTAPRAPRKSEALPGALTVSQKRWAVRLRGQGLGARRIGARLGVNWKAVEWLLKAKERA